MENFIKRLTPKQKKQFEKIILVLKEDSHTYREINAIMFALQEYIQNNMIFKG
ncbi:hypothetical protein [Chryseobacterium indoltheticum]|uniref:hypothetical protein n=1 Tax=Chryseobacterium indoltheticum TaxID=254 RepID=UPI0019123208|nr:hypothetical protein [Chryseobacterium indoltheticum]QQQ28675.1 hypothetical protein JJL46_01290 [Chryseobacterium indoltheticum]